MPMVLPAPVRPLAYSGLMLYLVATSSTEYWPGALGGATLGDSATDCDGTSPASAPVFGITAVCDLLIAWSLRPVTAVATLAIAAGMVVAPAGAW